MKMLKMGTSAPLIAVALSCDHAAICQRKFLETKRRENCVWNYLHAAEALGRELLHERDVAPKHLVERASSHPQSVRQALELTAGGLLCVLTGRTDALRAASPRRTGWRGAPPRAARARRSRRSAAYPRAPGGTAERAQGNGGMGETTGLKLKRCWGEAEQRGGAALAAHQNAPLDERVGAREGDHAPRIHAVIDAAEAEQAQLHPRGPRAAGALCACVCVGATFFRRCARPTACALGCGHGPVTLLCGSSSPSPSSRDCCRRRRPSLRRPVSALREAADVCVSIARAEPSDITIQIYDRTAR